ncbi:MAG: type 4a pilus biogenesis protein PilO [Myxococcota bacterium]
MLLALPVCSYFVVFRPVNTKIAQGKKEIEHKHALLSKLREATAQTADLQRANDQIRESIDSLQAKLPSSKEMDNVLRQVSGIAAKNGLKIPTFKKNDKTAPAGMAMEQPLDIEITGDFDGFYKFLLDIEQLPRITRFTDLEIVRSDKSGAQNTADGDMKSKFVLSVYYESDGSESK